MKTIKCVAVMVLCFIMMSLCSFATQIKVVLDDKPIDFSDQPPAIVDGRTLVPLRAIFEAVGATVEWNQTTKTITSEKDDVLIELQIGSKTLFKNGTQSELDVAAQIINGRTMVPARAIAEAFDIKVSWDNSTKTVILESKNSFIDLANISNQTNSAINVLTTTIENDTVYSIKCTGDNSSGITFINIPISLFPNETYTLSFDIKLDTDSSNAPVFRGNGDLSITHGVSSVAPYKNELLSFYASNKWSHISATYTTPTNLNQLDTITLDILINPTRNEQQTESAVGFSIKNIVIEKKDTSSQGTPSETETLPDVPHYPGTVLPKFSAIIGSKNYYRISDEYEDNSGLVHVYEYDEWEVLLNDVKVYMNMLTNKYGWSFSEEKQSLFLISWYFYKLPNKVVGITVDSVNNSIYIAHNI